MLVSLYQGSVDRDVALRKIFITDIKIIYEDNNKKHQQILESVIIENKQPNK